ncbi:MAG: hypothetical protein Q7S70_00310 [bacterium]|nr:hypothetical protein [bacterium]
MLRVLIVQEGQWGSVPKENYLEIVEMYKRVLEEAEESCGSEGKKQKEAEVTIVATASDAERIIKGAPLNTEVNAVVFVSRDMEDVAEILAATYPKLRVVVFTGLIPDGKVVWVSKAWAADSRSIQNIVLHY